MIRGCIVGQPDHIRLDKPRPEDAVANKEQKKSSREAKKPKQKKKGAEKSAAGKGQLGKA